MTKITLFIFIALAGLWGGTPQFRPVSGFDLERYLGKWYEIVRFDHRFERGLTNVTATYELSAPGRVRVINQGYKDAPDGKHSIAKGWAKFAAASDVGYLRVSFFRPFYGDYIIVELDPDYRYALVVSSSFDYLWILSRSAQLDETIISELLNKANALGFDISKIIRVRQDR
ncbi:MAG: lipocalin family protein [Candidatus Neomarinimicrobiota bacterium]